MWYSRPGFNGLAMGLLSPRRACRVSGGGEPSRLKIAKSQDAKKVGKIQKTALFDSSNRFTSARQGCQRFARSAKGNEGRGKYHAADPDRSPLRASLGFVRFCCCSSHPITRPNKRPPLP